MKENGLIIILNFCILNHVVKLYKSSIIFIGILVCYLKNISPGMEVDNHSIKNVLVLAKPDPHPLGPSPSAGSGQPDCIGLDTHIFYVMSCV